MVVAVVFVVVVVVVVVVMIVVVVMVVVVVVRLRALQVVGRYTSKPVKHNPILPLTANLVNFKLICKKKNDLCYKKPEHLKNINDCP